MRTNVVLAFFAIAFVGVLSDCSSSTSSPGSNNQPSGGPHIFAESKIYGAFVSTDNDSNLTAAENGLGSLGVTALAMSGTSVFAATAGGGTFVSSDNGSSCNQLINGGL